jgi:hypothetical protein
VSPENTKKLIDIYPELFACQANSLEPFALFGFECDDGWFEILKECIQKIKDESLEKDLFLTADQVKEKYGTLKIYLNQYTDSLQKIIDEAEEKSGKTCENCGKEGKLRKLNKFWLSVRCDDCTNKAENVK